MRPDRLVIGEVRSGEALDLLQAMNTGHDGSLTTIHANTPRDAIARIETMVAMSNMHLPDRAVRQQIASAIRPDILSQRLFHALATGKVILLETERVDPRDLLRGETPQDYDIATSARPEEVEAVLQAYSRVDPKAFDPRSLVDVKGPSASIPRTPSRSAGRWSISASRAACSRFASEKARMRAAASS
jgi:hypothetical protein